MKPDPSGVSNAVHRSVLDELESTKEQFRQANETIVVLRGRQNMSFPGSWRLTGTQKEILGCLIAKSPQIASYELLREKHFAASYFENKTIAVHVSKLNKKLKPFGVVIRCMRGEGYWIDAVGAERVLEATD